MWISRNYEKFIRYRSTILLLFLACSNKIDAGFKLRELCKKN
jgi:hypothetical protein